VAERDVPRRLRREFWTQVLIFNVALFALAVGVMVVAFEGRVQAGAVLVAGGALSFAHGWRRYRAFRERNG